MSRTRNYISNVIHFNNLNEALGQYLSSFLRTKDLLNLRRVNKQWCRFIKGAQVTPCFNKAAFVIKNTGFFKPDYRIKSNLKNTWEVYSDNLRHIKNKRPAMLYKLHENSAIERTSAFLSFQSDDELIACGRRYIPVANQF